ncbi:MAG: DUF362 domain-containing protein [Candidatus Cloacimonetes bacterium]|nr:DUF362 domain-containing protein [Candidatus Cloacimonadota bacterium]
MHIAIEKVEQYEAGAVRAFLERTLRPAMEARPEARRVLVKPNLLGAFKPERAVTTHPVVVEQTVRLLLDMGREVVVGDSPGGTVPVSQVYAETGIEAVARECGVPLLDFKQEGIREVKVDGVDLWVTQALHDCDAVVNLCKYKTHTLMLYTGAVKNLYGLVPGMKKSLYHRDYQRPEDFMKVLLALYGLVRPKLVYSVLDGIVGMEGEGPSGGKARRFGVLMGSESASALDLIAARMLGFEMRHLGYITQALHDDGVLPSRVTVDEGWEGFRFDSVDTLSVRMRHMLAGNTPRFVRNAFTKLFDFYPEFAENCKKCGICVESCPVDALSLGAGDDRPQLNLNACIRCMCCHEMCPHNAVDVRKSWLAQRILR